MSAQQWALNHPENRELLTRDAPSDGLAPDYAAEDERADRWARFIGDVREFAATERDGYAAVLRAVAEAYKGQRELFRG